MDNHILTLNFAQANEKYNRLLDPTLPLSEARHIIDELSQGIAVRTRTWAAEAARPDDATLVVFVLRGGALMLPAFLRVFSEADCALLALRRQPDGSVLPEYLSVMARSRYRSVILVDCIASTGRTVSTAFAMIQQYCTFDRAVLAVISASDVAREAVTDLGLSVIGHSVNESNIDGLLMPDFGARDAGDMFAGQGE